MSTVLVAIACTFQLSAPAERPVATAADDTAPQNWSVRRTAIIARSRARAASSVASRRPRSAARTPRDLDGAEVGEWLITNIGGPATELFDQIDFPVIKKVAIFLGETRVARTDRHLISEAQVLQMVQHLEPGDLILEKTNWYLCNLAIPGFWGHSELYLGSYDEALAYFDEPAVDEHFALLGFEGFADYLVSMYPDAVVRWRAGAETDGRTVRIIEADGLARRTILNSAEHGLTRDFVAALRPRLLSKLDKALALLVALSYLDQPYDFTFDVSSDDALTCTELLARAYASDASKRGLHFEIGRAGTGKPMIFPTSLVESYVREAGAADRQFSFVYFLKGDEATGQAGVGSERDFIDSASWTFPF
ncbi:MAG: hypothetical protein JXR83_03015 [Deltaproteobacteria bacterium]|nr:hypothetical protein [Deltaproteobacteria bacterium]